MSIKGSATVGLSFKISKPVALTSAGTKPCYPFTAQDKPILLPWKDYLIALKYLSFIINDWKICLHHFFLLCLTKNGWVCNGFSECQKSFFLILFLCPSENKRDSWDLGCLSAYYPLSASFLFISYGRLPKMFSIVSTYSCVFSRFKQKKAQSKWEITYNTWMRKLQVPLYHFIKITRENISCSVQKD